MAAGEELAAGLEGLHIGQQSPIKQESPGFQAMALGGQGEQQWVGNRREGMQVGEAGGAQGEKAAQHVLAGGGPALAALRELVCWPLLYAKEAAQLGLSWPCGLLLHGPPGCGKTLMVRAVAGESGARWQVGVGQWQARVGQRVWQWQVAVAWRLMAQG